MQVQTLAQSDPACDDFVRLLEGKICHTLAWGQMVQRCLGLGGHYLVAREDSQVRGVLPLSHSRSRLLGNRLISQAFASYGGILADGDSARQALLDKAVEIATAAGCESIEFRNVEKMPVDMPQREGKACMYLDLTADPEVLWKGFDAKVRNQVRKAEKNGITAVDGGLELLEDFYEVYTIRMRQLGTPCFPKGLMRGVLETFPEGSRVFVVRLGARAVGAAVTTCFNGFAEIPWAATLTDYNTLCPNNLLYWSVIKHYCLAGAKVFDFGRSTVGAGTWQFKKQWGPRQVDLNYQFWVPPGKQLSIASPDNPKYQRKVEMWKKLPLWLTRWAGPKISKHLG